MKIALVTCSSMPEFKTDIPNEDELLLSFLKRKNIEVELVVWDNNRVDWEAFNLVIIKSTWDYFDKPDAFRSWLDDMQQRKINLYNPAEIVRWNMDKIYLKDIEKEGIPVIPTIWLNRNTKVDLGVIIKQLEATAIIIKPRISGASKNTFKVTAENVLIIQEKLNELIKHEDFMAQPFMEEIMEGEYSFLFFNNQFSHAVKKVPHKDDFRVQHYFGGGIQQYAPDPSILEQAQHVSDAFAPDCLYARVDGIIKDDQLFIIELEVIEPMLYLFFHEQSCENFLHAIKSRADQQAFYN